MMNQKVVIYIILSAILLYLYYKRGGVALFVAFIVVVAGTLFAGASASEGFSLGGGGKGGDKQCAKLGFAEVKLVKDDVAEGLEKVMKNIEKVAEKEWPFEKSDYEGKRSKDETFQKNWNIIIDSSEVKEVLKKGKDDPDMGAGLSIYIATTEIYETFLNTTTTTSTKTEVIAKYNTSALDKLIKSGSTVIKLLERVKKSDDIKDGDAKVQKIMSYIMCLIKHWISIFKAMQKVSGGGNGDGGDDEEEKPKKKKKKETKKKKSDNEDEE